MPQLADGHENRPHQRWLHRDPTLSVGSRARPVSGGSRSATPKGLRGALVGVGEVYGQPWEQ